MPTIGLLTAGELQMHRNAIKITHFLAVEPSFFCNFEVSKYHYHGAKI